MAGVEVRGGKVRVYFQFKGEKCREPVGSATDDNIAHAERLAASIDHEMRTGTFDYARLFPGSRRLSINTVGHYADLWLGISENDVADTTLRSYRSKVKSHIKPRWGKVQADQVSPIELQTWVKSELPKTLASKTIKEIVTILRQIYRLYCSQHRQAYDPTQGIQVRLPDPEDPDPFNRNEIKRILTTPTKRVQELNMIEFMIWDGPRLSEAMALAWEDVVDLERGIIRYRRRQFRKAYRVTKTRRSTREKRLLAPAREALQRQWALTGHLPPQPIEIIDRDNTTLRKADLRFVFLNSNTGRPHYGDTGIRDRFFRHHLEKAGVRYRGPNQCRHTYASQLLSTGVAPIQWVAEQMGHTSPAMIYKHYGRWIAEDGPDINSLVETALEMKRET
nr:DUF3596 domain-containing protein [uncultured Halomonas sp.]